MPAIHAVFGVFKSKSSVVVINQKSWSNSIHWGWFFAKQPDVKCTRFIHSMTVLAIWIDFHVCAWNFFSLHSCLILASNSTLQSEFDLLAVSSTQSISISKPTSEQLNSNCKNEDSSTTVTVSRSEVGWLPSCVLHPSVSLCFISYGVCNATVSTEVPNEDWTQTVSEVD